MTIDFEQKVQHLALEIGQQELVDVPLVVRLPFGDDKAGLIPRVHGLMKSKGFDVFLTQKEVVGAFVSAFNRTGDTDLIMMGLQFTQLSPTVAGTTVHSTMTQVLNNFVYLSYDKYEPNTKFMVGVHELGHVLTPPEKNWQVRKSRRAIQQELEAIAYGVQFCVCGELGMDVKLDTLCGLQLYRIDRETFLQHSGLIQSISAEVLQWLS